MTAIEETSGGCKRDCLQKSNAYRPRGTNRHSDILITLIKISSELKCSSQTEYVLRSVVKALAGSNDLNLAISVGVVFYGTGRNYTDDAGA
jgi:hypothetical protein